SGGQGRPAATAVAEPQGPVRDRRMGGRRPALPEASTAACSSSSGGNKHPRKLFARNHARVCALNSVYVKPGSAMRGIAGIIAISQNEVGNNSRNKCRWIG